MDLDGGESAAGAVENDLQLRHLYRMLAQDIGDATRLEVLR
jgi:hypothetical protein